MKFFEKASKIELLFLAIFASLTIILVIENWKAGILPAIITWQYAEMINLRIKLAEFRAAAKQIYTLGYTDCMKKLKDGIKDSLDEAEVLTIEVEEEEFKKDRRKWYAKADQNTTVIVMKDGIGIEYVGGPFRPPLKKEEEE